MRVTLPRAATAQAAVQVQQGLGGEARNAVAGMIAGKIVRVKINKLRFYCIALFVIYLLYYPNVVGT